MQVTVWPATPQVQPVPLAAMPVNPAGRVSVSVTFAAVLPALLRGVSVNVTGWPETAGFGATLLPTDRSAPAATVNVAEPVLLFGSPSPTSGLSKSVVAEFVTVPVAIPGASCATICSALAAAPTAMSAGFRHVTFCPTEAQIQPLPLPDTKVRFAGNVSSTRMPPKAMLGPLLVTAKANVTWPPWATGEVADLVKRQIGTQIDRRVLGRSVVAQAGIPAGIRNRSGRRHHNHAGRHVTHGKRARGRGVEAKRGNRAAYESRRGLEHAAGRQRPAHVQVGIERDGQLGCGRVIDAAVGDIDAVGVLPAGNRGIGRIGERRDLQIERGGGAGKAQGERAGRQPAAAPALRMGSITCLVRDAARFV